MFTTGRNTDVAPGAPSLFPDMAYHDPAARAFFAILYRDATQDAKMRQTCYPLDYLPEFLQTPRWPPKMYQPRPVENVPGVGGHFRPESVPLVVIAPGAEYLSPTTTRISAIVLPANSTVRKAKDLNGKIVATTALHSLSETAPRVWIDQNGGDSSTVKFVELPYPAMPAALDAGRIDAAWVTEPFIGVATKSGRVLAYGFDGISKHFLFNAWFTTPQWAKAHPDLVSRFAAVMAETAAWANQNPAKSGEILAKYLKIDPAIIATLTRAHFAERLTPALMQPLIDVSAKYNNFSSFPARDLMYGPSR